jgi:sugar lactone lactonase YvrE
VLAKPSLFLDLPEEANGPDGMTMAPNGNILVACPNFVNPEHPGIIIEVDKANKWTTFSTAPVHPETKKGHPMGMDFGPDGNLYYADNQYFNDKDYKSRLMRVTVKDGKAVKTDVVVDGFKLSNAVIWKGNDVFVSDTFRDVEGKPGVSCIFKISLDEMNAGVVELKHSEDDPHIIASFVTVPNDRGDVAGADGMTIDSTGCLYVGNFGDGVMSKICFDADGNVAGQKIISKAITCCDGIFCDLATDDIYITDSAKNAIHLMRPDGTMKQLWANGDSDGSDGLLDQPCEPIIRGDELIVVNFDFATPEWGLINQKPDDKHNLSVFKLK